MTIEHSTTQRMHFARQARDAYRAMAALATAAHEGLDAELVALINLRASHLNHCAFCLDMHAAEGREAGLSDQRIQLVAAWEEAGALYSPREAAALALTEAVTVLTDGFVPDAVYQRAAAHFTEPELAQVIATIISINVWNRMAVTTRLAVAPR